MGHLFSKEVIIPAALTTLGMLIVGNLTSGQSKIIQGAAALGTAMLAIGVVAPKLK